MIELNTVLKKKKKLTSFLVGLFDIGSRITHLFLFNYLGYVIFLLLLFFIPVYYSEQFINFLIAMIKHPSNFSVCFANLPLLLKILLSFQFFILELVFLCTFLASIPLIQEQMIEKYQDPFILKKRGYNSVFSSLRRAASIGVPMTAAVIVAGDAYQHTTSVDAVLKINQTILEAYKENPNPEILKKMQEIPTGSFTTKVHKVTVSIFDTLAEWSFGSKKKN